MKCPIGLIDAELMDECRSRTGRRVPQLAGFAVAGLWFWLAARRRGPSLPSPSFPKQRNEAGC